MPNYDNWAEVIAELEAATRDAGDLTTVTDAAADAAWTPPTDLGELPADLRERALALLADQRASLHDLGELHRETGRHLAAVRAVPSTRQDQSVYLDVSG